MLKKPVDTQNVMKSSKRSIARIENKKYAVVKILKHVGNCQHTNEKNSSYRGGLRRRSKNKYDETET